MIPTHNSVGGENYIFKMLRNGPVVDTIVYLPPGEAVNRYADKEFKDFFDLHASIKAKLGHTASDNAKASKRVSGKLIRLFPMSDVNLRGLEAPLILASEIDALGKGLASKVINEIRGRQKAVASKAYIESHPDLGEDYGIAAGWKDGSRAVQYWSCVRCGKFSTPHHLAHHSMRAVMVYDRDDKLSHEERRVNAMATARLQCPHCQALVGDDDRYAMIDGHVWVEGVGNIDADGQVLGEAPYNSVQSFWLHGLMVKRPLADLAAEHLAATLHFETTRDPAMLSRYHVKSLGEIYEGQSVRKAASLKESVTAQQETFSFERGVLPTGFRFIVAAVDQGGSKFDVAWHAFDLEGRSALLDRITIKDRQMPDGSVRDIRPAENIDDWMQLQKIVIERRFPLQDDPTRFMPVAIVAIDTGGSGKRDKQDMPDGATYKAREFARRMNRAGMHWGPSRYQRVKLFKGFASKDDAIILKSRNIDVDENNQPVEPRVTEFNINVNRTKKISVDRLAVDDGGPGQCYFANGLPESVYAELCAERLENGAWVRRGANETFDLMGYNIALCTLLDPDNERYNWNRSTPIWATPISFTEAEKPAGPKLSKWELRNRMMEQE